MATSVQHSAAMNLQAQLDIYTTPVCQPTHEPLNASSPRQLFWQVSTKSCLNLRNWRTRRRRVAARRTNRCERLAPSKTVAPGPPLRNQRRISKRASLKRGALTFGKIRIFGRNGTLVHRARRDDCMSLRACIDGQRRARKFGEPRVVRVTRRRRASSSCPR
eukprot:881930-Pyramimonas_sp.AAC.1